MKTKDQLRRSSPEKARWGGYHVPAAGLASAINKGKRD